MESVTENTPAARRNLLPVIAIIGGVIAIASLFIYWVNIHTTFSYSFFEIPYAMKATAIKVVEGSTDIPNDWHIYCPALAGIFAIIGAVLAVVAIIKKDITKKIYLAIIVCGILSVVFALLFASWNFDVMYTVTESDAKNITFLSAALAAVLGDPTALMAQSDIQSVMGTFYAVMGDPTAQDAVRQQVIDQAVAGGMDRAAAEAYFTTEVAVQTAAAQVQQAMGIDLYDAQIQAALTADPSGFMTQYAASAVKSTMGLDLYSPAVQKALIAANPADFVAGKELVVGYMKVREVVEAGFRLCVVGGLFVIVGGLVAPLRAAAAKKN